MTTMRSPEAHGQPGKRVVFAWEQTKEELSLLVRMPPGTLTRDIVCRIEGRNVYVATAGDPKSLIDGELWSTVNRDYVWSVQEEQMTIEFEKAVPRFWPTAFVGGPEIDVDSLIKEEKESQQPSWTIHPNMPAEPVRVTDKATLRMLKSDFPQLDIPVGPDGKAHEVEHKNYTGPRSKFEWGPLPQTDDPPEKDDGFVDEAKKYADEVSKLSTEEMVARLFRTEEDIRKANAAPGPSLCPSFASASSSATSASSAAAPPAAPSGGANSSTASTAEPPRGPYTWGAVPPAEPAPREGAPGASEEEPWYPSFEAAAKARAAKRETFKGEVGGVGGEPRGDGAGAGGASSAGESGATPMSTDDAPRYEWGALPSG